MKCNSCSKSEMKMKKAGKKGDEKLHEMAIKRHEKDKMKKVKKEFEEGKLHSGSKKGPVVTNPKQMLAIAYSEAKEAKKNSKKKKK